ncbi:uncharacterized protein LOC132893517 [Neoarius graeffei]|uniref:uncharacterized protein LOC132893517 n=1 Tax=Neoarius graeffei TaxID=443677 RepID=UPI00298CE5FB|nr:uncharacterized protein LOC132893517 [Neoarius graeffei]
MHRLFSEQNHLQVTYSLYWSIFVYDFNLAFGHPAKDVCSMCVKSRMAMNDPGLKEEEKREKILQYSLHRRRARQFYNILNDVGDSFTVCFDVMENLVLPKSAIVQTYYSRQLYYYVFGVVRHHGRGESQSRHDIHLYTWLEYENAKDSNMIASALQHYFTAVAADNLHLCQCLRLFSNSCYGQNKNINVLSMLFGLRSQLFPHLTINYFFPVRGHSFLPADRVFGRIEQDIRKHTTILLPDEYASILHRHGNIHQYGRDWQCYDFKKEAAAFTTQQRSFKISDARVIQICGERLDVKSSFAGDFTQHSVLKRGKRWPEFAPAPLPDVNCVKLAKKRDVLKLLCELGVPATVQELYNDVLSSAGDRDIAQDLEDE